MSKAVGEDRQLTQAMTVQLGKEQGCGVQSRADHTGEDAGVGSWRRRRWEVTTELEPEG